MKNATNSLAHTKWNCKYDIVFSSKYRRKVNNEFGQPQKPEYLILAFARLLHQNVHREHIALYSAVIECFHLNNENYKEILLKQFDNANSDFVISGDEESFLRLHQFEYRYRKFFKDNNFNCLSPHKCRHIYATYLVKGGADLRTVQTLLGTQK